MKKKELMIPQNRAKICADAVFYADADADYVADTFLAVVVAAAVKLRVLVACQIKQPNAFPLEKYRSVLTKFSFCSVLFNLEHTKNSAGYLDRCRCLRLRLDILLKCSKYLVSFSFCPGLIIIHKI